MNKHLKVTILISVAPSSQDLVIIYVPGYQLLKMDAQQLLVHVHPKMPINF